jgi:hypothetical protein
MRVSLPSREAESPAGAAAAIGFLAALGEAALYGIVSALI